MGDKDTYNQALEDLAKRIITYYGNIDTTQGISVQYYVKQLLKELKKEN
jgi:hypothetical protein